MRDRTRSSGTNVSRRGYLLAAGAVGASALAGCAAPIANTAATAADHSSPDLEKWVDEVPRPGVAEPTGTKEGQPHYEVELNEVEQQLHSDLPPTTVWGYGGQYPGPTIEAEQGEPIYVRWTNMLPDEHLLPEDTTIHPEMIPYDMPGSRVVTHLHGGNVEAESDGNPLAWSTREFEETGPEFEKRDYYYENDQPPATLWYHDHSLGITRLNVYAGLAGFYILRNDHERDLGLPSGEYEVPLVFQDRRFNADGSLFYPTAVPDQDDAAPNLSIVPQFYGDTSVVNGKVWPRLPVEPRKYRFRLLNGANSRFYNLRLLEYDEDAEEAGKAGPSFVQIGNDGGLFAEPVGIDGRLEMGPSQRADVVVDFADYAGETLLVHNDAPAMYTGESGTNGDADALPEVMLVEVGESAVEDDSRVPGTLTEVPEIGLDAVTEERYLTLTQDVDDYGRELYLLGTEEEQSGLGMDDPVTEEPALGDTEIWSFANLTGMSHPMHLHLVHFQVLGRQPVGDYDPAADGIDPEAIATPEPYERGWNDVVSVHAREVVHVAVRFGAHDGLFTDQTGEYMWHCHMIEHEDHDMMRPFRVLSESESSQGEGEDDSSKENESTDSGS
ncbi:multicopper oxidase domain-containing protein [Saliphagus infecundisoli]|uniref:Multicopper oxidase domain-containing protein n=1 Tax=Saliphagus infecundisoli TaxID=1849069 RepID=A0ABD5QCQ8_9EURY|nr:multicopper oxidase domain-containing protein [Saliphagus infecundisoli]